MKKIYAIFVCLIFLGTILAASTSVVAPKPEKPPGGGGGGGPEPTGTIFFKYYDGTDYSVWTMNADGSSKTKQILLGTGVQSLSRLQHGGHYWYAGFAAVDGMYPDGFQRYELFAVRDDNSSRVQLTNDATLSISQDWTQPVWSPDDETISWVAKRFTDDTVTEAGIYTAETTFDGNGDLTSIGTVSLLWECDLWYSSGNDMYHPIIGNFDWSPDSTKLVIQKLEETSNLCIVDLSAETETFLTPGYTPKWSPDGSKIAYHDAYDINTINIDGSGEKTIVAVSDSKGWQYSTRDVRWSPDGNFLSYTLRVITLNNWIMYKGYIYIVSADGSGNKCLTKSMTADHSKSNLDWR